VVVCRLDPALCLEQNVHRDLVHVGKIRLNAEFILVLFKGSKSDPLLLLFIFRLFELLRVWKTFLHPFFFYNFVLLLVHSGHPVVLVVFAVRHSSLHLAVTLDLVLRDVSKLPDTF